MHRTQPLIPIKPSPGFTLIELLIAMVIGMLVLWGIFSFFISQNHTFKLQEQVAEMQQNVRAGMDMVVREIRMAGFNPRPNDIPDPDHKPRMVLAADSEIRFIMDIDESGTTEGDANENIAYDLCTSVGVLSLCRNSNFRSGTRQAVVENIETDGLLFRYFDANGTEIIPPTGGLTNQDILDQIREVEITLRGRTADPDPNFPHNNGFRTLELTSRVVLRNLR